MSYIEELSHAFNETVSVIVDIVNKSIVQTEKDLNIKMDDTTKKACVAFAIYHLFSKCVSESKK